LLFVSNCMTIMMDSTQSGLTSALSASGPDDAVRLGQIRHRAAMRWRAGLGQRPRVLPAQTSCFVPVVSDSLVALRGAVRDRPFASSRLLLRQRRQSAAAQCPAARPDQDGTGLALIAPPFLGASACFLLHSLMSILIVAKSLGPNDPSSATRHARRMDCKPRRHAGFAAAHG
jgi:hypothetical protein